MIDAEICLTMLHDGRGTSFQENYRIEAYHSHQSQDVVR